MFDLPKGRSGREQLRRLVAAKLRKANGALDRYDPYIGARRQGCFTRVNLARIFPEFFDPVDELAAELRATFEEIRERLAEAEAHIAAVDRAARMRDGAVVRKVESIVRMRRVPALASS